MEPPGVAVSAGRRALIPHHRDPRIALLAVAALTAACVAPGANAPSAGTAGSPDPSAGAATSSAPNPTTASTPAGSRLPGLFRVVGDEPVIARTAFPNRGAILPASVAVDDGTYHAWVVAFAETPGTQEIHHLTSSDAVAWTEVPDASLEALSDGLGDPGAFPTSVVRDVDGWVMYLTGILAGERDAWEIWRATAPVPDGPWTRSKEPVLRRGRAGAWDAGGLDFPTVIRTDDGYAAFYSGIDTFRRETGAIGRATSPDGVAWTKHDDPATTDAGHAASDPVVMPGLCGGFDSRAIHQPRVVALADRLVMAYAGYAGDINSRASVGFADSRDGGETWDCRWPSSALDTTGLPSGFVHTMVAFPRGDRLALLVEWLADRGTDDWLAEAPATLP